MDEKTRLWLYSELHDMADSLDSSTTTGEVADKLLDLVKQLVEQIGEN